MVRVGVEQAFAARLTTLLTAATRSRIRAYVCGLFAATVLQSATAVAMLSASFVSGGLISLGIAIVIILGADMGSALAVRILFVDLSFLPSLFIFAGLCLYRFSAVWRKKELGKILIGLGLMLLSIGLMKQSVAPLVGNAMSKEWLVVLESTLLITLVATAVITWLAHSSVAVVLVVASMFHAQVLTDTLAVSMLLGANVGSGLIALFLVNRRELDAFSAVVANFLMRLVGALVAWVFLDAIIDFMVHLGASNGAQVINLHLAFNFLLGLVFIGLNNTIAGWIRARLDQSARLELERTTLAPGSALDLSLVSQPDIALTSARREAFRLADNTEMLFRNTLRMFESDDRSDIEKIVLKDGEINARHKAIQSFLIETRRHIQDATDSDQQTRLDDILRFSSTMENIGDVVSHGLARLAIKRFNRAVVFSPNGQQELEEVHREVLGVIQLAIGYFASGVSDDRKQLTLQIDRARNLGYQSINQHRERLTKRQSNSISTSSIHQDTIRDFMQVVALIDNMGKS